MRRRRSRTSTPATRPARGRIRNYVARTSDARAFAADLRRIVHELDPSRAIFDVRPLQDVMDTGLDQPRLDAAVLGLFAGAALLLAAIGLYSLFMLVVSESVREIAVRLAIGAAPATGDAARDDRRGPAPRRRARHRRGADRRRRSSPAGRAVRRESARRLRAPAATLTIAVVSIARSRDRRSGRPASRRSSAARVTAVRTRPSRKAKTKQAQIEIRIAESLRWSPVCVPWSIVIRWPCDIRMFHIRPMPLARQPQPEEHLKRHRTLACVSA